MKELVTRDFFGERGAVFSDCRRYRYALWRTWDRMLGCLTLIMLNPSTADEIVNDPTIERCQRRAYSMGFGRINVVNLFAYRATDPNEMKAQSDPIGPGNDDAILEMASRSSMVIAAWGCHGDHLSRAAAIRALLRERKIQLYHLGLTQSGQPRHPLYINYSHQPVPWEWEAR